MHVKSLFRDFVPGAIIIALFCILPGHTTVANHLSQAIGDSTLLMNENWCIFLLNEKEICEVKLTSLHKGSLEYEAGGKINMLSSADFSRLEGKIMVLWFDSTGIPYYNPYDRITGKGGDTILALIRDIKGTYINCYLKGKTKAGFLPINAVKDYVWNSRDNATQAQTTPLPETSSQEPVQEPVKQLLPDTTRTNASAVQQPSAITNSPFAQEPKKDENCYMSYLQGENAARQNSPVVWGGAGAVAGCCGCSWAVPMIGLYMKYNPREYPPGINEDCYKLGYANRAKHNGIMAASIGSAIMTISVGIAYYFILVSSNSGF